jgi:hypothetical protein
MRAYLGALFKPGELIGTYGPEPRQMAYIGPWEAAQPAEYVTLNPLITNVRKSHVMADYRNFLLEFDSVSLPEQLHLISMLEAALPIRTITYSGGKSYHCIIALSDSLVTGKDGEMRALLYTDYFRKLRSAATNLITPHLREKPDGDLIDKSNADASRLTRLPGTTNRQWKYPDRPWTEQTLLRTGGLVCAEDFELFLNKHSTETFGHPLTAAPCYNGTFERTLNKQSHLRGLRDVLCVPEKWAGRVGNHPHIYRYTMWAIDATGVGQPEFMEFIKKFTAPYITSLGYNMWQIEEAVEGAYKIKQRRTR